MDIFKKIVVLTLILLSLSAIYAEDGNWYEGETITDITFTGLVNVKDKTAKSVVSEYVGQPFTDELFTELDFTETDKGIMLSQSEQYRLPGKIRIKLRNSKSDYKYFYMCSNDGKSLRKLNSLSGDNTFSINSAGDYLLTTERAESFRINIVWVLGAAGVILLMSVVYIFTKRKYWFW